MSNLKLDANELICEMDSQTQRTDLCLSGGKRVAEGWIGSLGLRHACRCVLSHIRLFAIPWTAAHQASLSFTVSQTLLKLMSFVLMVPFNHLTLCRPLLLPSIFPSIRIFPKSQLFASGGLSNGTSASASVLLMNIQDRSPLGLTGWISLQSKTLKSVLQLLLLLLLSGFSHVWPYATP